MRKRLLIGMLVIACIVVYVYRDLILEPEYLHQQEVPADKKYIFKGLQGPEEKSVVPEPVAASWQNYSDNNPSALAIFLTDTASDWLGLSHGLKNIGIPFIITNNLDEAIKHHTVMVYPIISGKVLTTEQLRTLAAIPRNGGNLIGFNVYGGGLNEVFGFDTVISVNNRTQLALGPPVAGITDEFTHDHEQNIRLTNPADFPDDMPGNGYTNARTPLISYKEDNTAFLAYKDYGVGKAFAFGIDLGNYFLRYMNERGFNAYRTYANNYDPGMDVMLRILKNIYTASADGVVTIGTVPNNKELSLIITHDIDYTKSIVNAAKYAQVEHDLGISATYFIQTKYIRDWNDDIFYTTATAKYLDTVINYGMEIASHSVSHSRVFSSFNMGTGKETYPKYSPFVQERSLTYNGSILGELRVSKFLLESQVKGAHVISFRPGHLQHPFALPQALLATGYQYSSAVTANNVQTHLPYMKMYDRGFSAETNIVEIPITIEDELGVPMLQRLDSALMVAAALSKYGGVMNVLIHTDTLGQKLEFEKQLVTALKDKAYITTIRQLGQWWRTRNAVTLKVSGKGSNYAVVINNPGAEAIDGLPIHIPATWQLTSGTDCKPQGSTIIINKLKGSRTLQFTANTAE